MKTLFLLFCIFFTTSNATFASANDSNGLTLLIHPFLDEPQILKRFTPLAKYLSHKLKQAVDIKISDQYSSHISSIGNDNFDFAYIGPYAYVKMTQQFNKKPLLGRLEIRGKPFFQGKIVTLLDSPIRNIKDLKGKNFAFGDPSSTMSYLLPKHLLMKNGISLSQLKSHRHYLSHSAVIDAVLSKSADAGAVKEEMYYKNMTNLKSIASTPEISEHLFLASNKMPKPLIIKIKKALLTMHQEKEGLIAMRALKTLMTGIVPVKHEDYDNLSSIYSASQHN